MSTLWFSTGYAAIRESLNGELCLIVVWFSNNSDDVRLNAKKIFIINIIKKSV